MSDKELFSSEGKELIPPHLAPPAEVTVRYGCRGELTEEQRTIVEELGVSHVTAKILIGREIRTVEEAKKFLYPSLREHLPDPGRIKNIKAAALILIEAIEAQTLISVYSDFDVDGLSSGAQLELYLSALGANVNHYTPNRFTEGYGLAKSAIEKLVRGGTGVLFTVDCGVTNHQELAYAKHLGLRTVVLDHHQMNGMPPADVVVDPVQPGCEFGKHELCAAGLVWMLLIVLRRELNIRWKDRIATGSIVIPDPKKFLDLAALGTICDMVPLRGLNRVIAHRGVEALRKTTRPGLVALKEVSGIPDSKLNAGHVSFAIGPRINAAGRIDDPGKVFDLLTTGSSVRAKSLAQSISRLNDRRRAIEEEVRLSCLDIIAKDESYDNAPALALFGEDFHLGVVGIVAQRMVECFNKPAAVMGLGEMMVGNSTRTVIRGSVRSIPGFHISDALKTLDESLIKHGGHAAAGGFSLEVENLEIFQCEFVNLARRLITEDILKRKKTADVQVALSELTYELVDELKMLQPFGIGNPSPLLVSTGVRIESVQGLGNGHLKLRIRDDAHYVTALAWRLQGHPLLVKGKKVNIAYQPEINSYRGVSSVQLNIKEVWDDVSCD